MQHPMLTIAVRAVRTAGSVLTKYYEILHTMENRQRDNNTFITQIEKAVEAIIIKIIHKAYPKHTIITGESSERVDVNQHVEWIIDPLVGTDNFIKCLPHFSISIAVRIKGRTEVGVIYDPMRNELFTATRGQGAQLSGYRLRCSTFQDLEGTVLATGFPTKSKQHVFTYMNILRQLFTECADFRCTGSAALDLAYVAAGRVDGYFETALKLQDFAAGELIAREAGLLVCDFDGGHNYTITGNLIVGNPRIVKAMLANIRNDLNNVLEY